MGREGEAYTILQMDIGPIHNKPSNVANQSGISTHSSIGSIGSSFLKFFKLIYIIILQYNTRWIGISYIHFNFILIMCSVLMLHKAII